MFWLLSFRLGMALPQWETHSSVRKKSLPEWTSTVTVMKNHVLHIKSVPSLCIYMLWFDVYLKKTYKLSQVFVLLLPVCQNRHGHHCSGLDTRQLSSRMITFGKIYELSRANALEVLCYHSNHMRWSISYLNTDE